MSGCWDTKLSAALTKLTLWETDNNYVEYAGRQSPEE